jgi:hypothetical protein
MKKVRLVACVFLGSSALALLNGCSGGTVATLPSGVAVHAIQGTVRGGQQPVTGATIQLYYVGAGGDGSAATGLLTPAVQSGPGGNFTLTGLFTCPTPSTLVYLLASGGNPGLAPGTNNTAIAMMAALGQCSTLTSTSFLFVDEATTVGALAALYPYMTSATHLGSGSGDAAALAAAFTLANSYTSVPTGTVSGNAQATIDSLSNSVAACINTIGGGAGDGSPCGNLFNLTKVGGIAPTDTIGAVLNVLNNPNLNVTAIFNLGVANPPFQPALGAAPPNWYLPIVNTYSVGGQITSTSGCNGGGLSGITVSINTDPVQTTTTNGSGNYSFSNVPNGTYTVTPSITGPSSIFYPASESVVVNGNNVTPPNFSATLGYTVSGTVAYAGSQTGQTYLVLNPTSCGGGGTVGTSISTKGAYTIRGVPPGSYTLQSYLDNLGKGIPNASNPSGSSSVTVAAANLTGANVTLVDPAPVTLTSAPVIQGIAGFNSSAIAQYTPMTNGSGVETPTSYTLQWSSTLSPFTVAGSETFPANGTKTNAWLVSGLTGASYYFRATATSAGTAAGTYYSSIYGPVTIGATSGPYTVSGAISFPVAATGPLFVGFLSQTTGAFYAEYFAAPVSAQAYSIQMPADTYQFFGILDQNHDGVIDVGDLQNASDNGNSASVTISGNTSNENLTLPSASAIGNVTTQNFNSVSQGGSSQGFDLSFQVQGLTKLPVAVTLTSGPNLINPIDIAVCGGLGSSCGQGFDIYFSIGSAVPSVGDTYTFNVTYGDGTNANVTAVVSGVVTAFATNPEPQTGNGTSITPTFTWNYPANAANYSYSFSLCCSNGSDIWDIPGNNSNANGFSSSQIPLAQIPWSTTTDPTGASNAPSVPSLTHGTVYSWQIQVSDSNGNSAATQVNYQP